jgi:molybdopterin-guanine dinucleotide biosynthesis protein A
MLCGIFVGGRATRMGGITKGLLPAPETGEPLVLRLARIARELGLEPVLVGASGEVRAALPELRTIDDRPAGIGPLGGLAGLLHAAGFAAASRAQTPPASTSVLALACDLPRGSRALIARLVEAPLCAPNKVLAIRADNGLWEPLCARYDADALRVPVEQAIARGVRSFQKLFAELQVGELSISGEQRAELVDWDTPEDVARS